MRYSPPAINVFSTPEREFLRIAATASPDWDRLRELGAQVKDWHFVWTAPPGQLDGVMCWRLLDPRMDGIVPEETREECRGHLAWLTSCQAVWQADVEAVLKLLNEAQVRYYCWGFPTGYASCGIDPEQWPRDGRQLSVTIASEDYQGAFAMLEEAGRRGWRRETLGQWLGERFWWVHAPGGTVIKWECCPPDHPHTWHGVRNWLPELADPLIFDSLVTREVYGVPMPVPPPEILVCLRALSGFTPLRFESPFTLFACAEIASHARAITDRGLLERYLRRLSDHVQKMPAHMEVGAQEYDRRGLPGTALLRRMKQAPERCGALPAVGWVNRLCSAVYPEAAEALKPLGAQHLLPLLWRHPGLDVTLDEPYECRDDFTRVEEFIFGPPTMEARMALGLIGKSEGS